MTGQFGHTLDTNQTRGFGSKTTSFPLGCEPDQPHGHPPAWYTSNSCSQKSSEMPAIARFKVMCLRSLTTSPARSRYSRGIVGLQGCPTSFFQLASWRLYTSCAVSAPPGRTDLRRTRGAARCSRSSAQYVKSSSPASPVAPAHASSFARFSDGSMSHSARCRGAGGFRKRPLSRKWSASNAGGGRASIMSILRIGRQAVA